jgi:hypothetical protein
LRPLWDEFRPLVLALLREQSLETDPLVDVVKVVPRSRRSVLRACRAGAIAGVTKTGRTWVARRSDVDAWLAAQRRPTLQSAAARDVDELDDLRAAMGLRAVGGRR